jgi:hypothetical protein
MKTLEQIQSETINYLSKTLGHTFIKPKSTFNWKESKYEYDYNDSTYFKLIKIENDFYILENNKLSKLDIEHYFKYYGKNAKCVIKHRLFLDKKMKSIKYNKFVQEQIDQILQSLKK